MDSSFLCVVYPFPKWPRLGPSHALPSLIKSQNSRSQMLETHHLCAFRPSALISDAFRSHIWARTRDGFACATGPFMTSSAVCVRALPPVTYLTSTIRPTEQLSA